MKAKKIVSFALSALLLFGATACQTTQEQRVLTNEEIAAIASKLPDYSSVDKQYNFFGYSAASDGYWSENGIEYYCGKDLRTVEQFQMYKDAGMTFMHPQGSAGIQAADNFVYASSPLKKVLDTAQAAGIDKVIVPDYRVTGLIQIVSQGIEAAEDMETFAAVFKDDYNLFTDEGELDQTALENKLQEYMGEYAQHPSFYGVVLKDEPLPDMFSGYGEVYRAIKRLYPDAYMLCNLLPPAGFNTERLDDLILTEEELAEFEGLKDQWRFAAWKKYITAFLDETGIDYLMYDQYPIGNEGMHSTYIRALQIAAGVCKERGIDFYLVSQACAINHTRILDAESAAWLNNMALGMGIKTIGYYTYFDRASVASEICYDGAGFVTHFGEKTEVYDIMQNILSQNQAMAPTLLSFSYQTSAVYSATALAKYPSVCISSAAKNANFAKVSSVTVDKESALVSELYDADNNRYMYMIQNIVDPDYTGHASWQTTTLTFNQSYNYAVVWSNGERQVVSLVDNQYTITQHPGQAVYVIPFSA